MHALHIQVAVAVTALTASSMTFAHGDGLAGSTLYHYMSSPDHVIAFCVLALVTLGSGAWALRRSVVLARQKKRRSC